MIRQHSSGQGTNLIGIEKPHAMKENPISDATVRAFMASAPSCRTIQEKHYECDALVRILWMILIFSSHHTEKRCHQCDLAVLRFEHSSIER